MQAITDFQLAQQAYQMAMTASARILQMSIMDYLR
jgi:flagellin-like hook-associated protein FlgL